MSLFDRVADYPVRIEDCELEPYERETSSDFTRRTTVIALHGDGCVGYGEDVTYDENHHEAVVETMTASPITGTFTVESASAALDDVDLFPDDPPEREPYRHHRRWGFESAVLDLALKQADTNLADAFDRSYDPVRFVVSMRLGDPPTVDRVASWLDIDPALEFKLDVTPAWTSDLIAQLAATGRVCVLDFKDATDRADDDEVGLDVYRDVITRFPNAVIEDPRFDSDTGPMLRDARRRISWDHRIDSIERIETLPFEPQWLNVKPSRFGTVEQVFDAIDYCFERDIEMYGGGQFELAVGREHIHALASLFYPESPNDVAPQGYNDPEPQTGLDDSPLQPPEAPTGLDWDD